MQSSFSALPSGSARTRRPSVRDPRLIVGLVLIAFSVWLGMWAVNNAKELEVAYVAARPLLSGQTVTQSDFRAVEVNLGQASGHYLTQTLKTDVEYVVQGDVREGELVPSTAIDTHSNTAQRVIAIPMSSPLSGDVEVGSVVDLWLTPATGSGSTENDSSAAEQIAQNLRIYQLPSAQSGFSGVSRSTVHVLVPNELVGRVLASVQDRAQLTLVARPLGGTP